MSGPETGSPAGPERAAVVGVHGAGPRRQRELAADAADAAVAQADLERAARVRLDAVGVALQRRRVGLDAHGLVEDGAVAVVVHVRRGHRRGVVVAVVVLLIAAAVGVDPAGG